MTTAVAVKSLVSLSDQGKIEVVSKAKKIVKEAVVAFLDMISTSTGQKTYYNKKSDQLKVMRDIHNAVYDLNSGLYLAMLSFPGVMDIAIQEGITRLLKDGRHDGSILTPTQEAEAIKLLSSNLKADRLLKMFGMFREKRINKGSVRALILTTILAHRNLLWWAVKYRRHLKGALRHAWGTKYTPVIVRILAAGYDSADAKDQKLVQKQVLRYAKFSKLDQKDIFESICFVFGAKVDFKNDLFKAFEEAKSELGSGRVLPVEVLEGIRGRYHKDVDKAKVLDLTKGTSSDKQKLRMTRKAKEAGVDLKMDATKLDPTSMYVAALETGMTDDMREALDAKAKQAAAAFPLKYEKVAIVVDTSKSMSGTDVNKNRPLAVSLAMRDLLAETGDAKVYATQGDFDSNGLVEPAGDSSLGLAVAKAFQDEPDVVFVITDGYENAPAGRTHEVIDAVRKLGIETPVYQFNPVMAKEAVGIRKVSDHVSALPMSKPEGIGMSLIRAAIEQDIDRGLQALVDAILPRITKED